MSNIWDEGVNYVWGGAKQRKKKHEFKNNCLSAGQEKQSCEKLQKMTEYVHVICLSPHIQSHLFLLTNCSIQK